MKPAVKTFSELAYLMKAGKLPEADKPKEKVSRWSIYYGKMMLEENLPYPVAVEKTKVYKRFGRIYPDKTKFKILPFQK